MLKPYEELRKIDVRPYCKIRKEGKDEILYLNWAKCTDLLYQNGAEKVYFEPIQQEGGTSLIKTDVVFEDKGGNANRAYETRIKVVIDDRIIEFQGPVMNGVNPVKDNSMTQQRLWNCQCRLFVKAVAIHTGLGFDLWLSEEENEQKITAQADMYHDILKVQQRVFETVTAIQKKTQMNLSQIADRMNRTEEELKQYLNMYKVLYSVENNLECILREVK